MQMPLGMNYAAFNNLDPNSQLMFGNAFGADQSQLGQQPQFLLPNPQAHQFGDQQQLAAQASMFGMQGNPLNMQAAMMMQQQPQFQNQQNAQGAGNNSAGGQENSGLTQGQSYTQITLNMKTQDPTTGQMV